jgi:hypothetical protein
MPAPLVVVNTVGLTCRHLEDHGPGAMPTISALAHAGWYRPLREVLPAVTCSTQASMLTGEEPSVHGIVGNGWLYRDTMEVRFWQQSNRLLHAPPVYQTAAERAAAAGRTFRCAKLFWWFNQGARVALSVTPKPHYGADGNKAFDILTEPDALSVRLKKKLGPFPFHTFWGPLAGWPCSEWIARCAAEVLRDAAGVPDLTLVYLPHLDYETQRRGPARVNWPKLLGELDKLVTIIVDAAKSVGGRVWIVNECCHVDVDYPILINRSLNQAGYLRVRHGPFGDQLDAHESRALAVCDHQLAHVYVRDEADLEPVAQHIAKLTGVARVVGGDVRGELGLLHPRAGDLIALAKPNAWFAYPFWKDDAHAPDYARTVDIHRKPGYDPCELFFDPRLKRPKFRMFRRLLRKKLGFRALFDVIPLDPQLVCGSHGLSMPDLLDRPVFIGDGSPNVPPCEMSHTYVHNLILQGLELM